MDSTERGTMVMNWVESSLVLGVKEKQDLDPMSLEFKVNVHKQKKLSFVQGGDGVFIYQSRLSALMVDGLQERIWGKLIALDIPCIRVPQRRIVT